MLRHRKPTTKTSLGLPTILPRDLPGRPAREAVLYLNVDIAVLNTANLRTNIMDFRGFDSSIILIIRGAILMSIGGFLEVLSLAILGGIMSVGRLGVAVLTSLSSHFAIPSFTVCSTCQCLFPGSQDAPQHVSAHG